MPLSPAELARYHRHLVLSEIGPEGQERLRAARVLVVGAGGLGSPAALYLAAAGIGTLGVLDCDHVDTSNLQRQVLFDCASVGQPKAAMARERLVGLNPEIEIVAHAVELQAVNARELLSPYDVILDGTDRLATRYLVNDACVLLGKPLVTAAIHRFEGQAMTYIPGRGPCYRCLFPEAQDGLVASCAEAGVLGVLPGVLGALQATEAIKLVLGIGEPLCGRMLSYDALELRFREFTFQRRPDCAVCGERPTITALRDFEPVCNAAVVAQIRRLTPRQLQSLLAAHTERSSCTSVPEDSVACAGQLAASILLVDVRQPREFSEGHLGGSINIPLDELQHRMSEITGAVTPVFICRSGARSLTAGALALRAGIQAPGHLEGGLLAWSAQMDPSLQVAPV